MSDTDKYLLIDVSKHSDENIAMIRNLLLTKGLIVGNGLVTTSGPFSFEVIE